MEILLVLPFLTQTSPWVPQQHPFIHVIMTMGLSSGHSVLVVHMENEELSVFGAAYAMYKILGPACFRKNFSTSNFSLQMD